jgi:putative NADH-flavin reductase
MEKEVVTSGLDWTIVRPTQLTNKPATRHVRYERTNHDFSSGPYSINRADVALALLDVAENTSDMGVALAISASGKS